WRSARPQGRALRQAVRNAQSLSLQIEIWGGQRSATGRATFRPSVPRTRRSVWAGPRRSGAAALGGEVLVDERDRHRALADGRGHPLRGAGAHVARGKHAWDTRLEERRL